VAIADGLVYLPNQEMRGRPGGLFCLDAETGKLCWSQKVGPGVWGSPLVAPGGDVARLQLPRDDASWFWSAAEGSGGRMRVYFAPTAAALGLRSAESPGDRACVSVSRGHVFLGRTVIEEYVRAWMAHLGLDADGFQLELGASSGATEWSAGPIAGQMLLDDVTIEDLLRFVGLDKILAEVRDFAALSADPNAAGGVSLDPEGIRISLARGNALDNATGWHALTTRSVG